MSQPPNQQGRALDEIEPPYDDPSKQPKTLTKTRHISNVLYVAGRAPVEDRIEYDIMFVTTSVEEEEATAVQQNLFGFRIPQPPEYLKGPTGIIKDVASRSGVDMDKCYYTAVCKWLLPRMVRNKPPMKTLRWGLPILLDEIKRVKPKIVVCLGKPAFDLLSDQKIGFKEAHGGWFWSTEANAHIYLMWGASMLLGKPELYEAFRVDFNEIHRKHQLLLGNDIDVIPIRSQVIDNEQDLRDWVAQRLENQDFLQVVDGEWHGKNHLNGLLRTLQFCWSESDAMLIEFRVDNVFTFGLEDSYDVEMAKFRCIGDIMRPLLEHPEFRYIGHHIAADWPWLIHWLGINPYGRCVMDTEFAQQALDEASELGLERGIAMKYTTLGLYSLDLILWKKAHKKKCEDGYGFIPREILYPYAIKDVITPMRAYPMILKQLKYQQLLDYHNKLMLPFVTDVFTSFAVTGLPCDVPLMDELRELLNFAKGRLEIRFRETLHKRAKATFRNALVNELGLLEGLEVATLCEGKSMDETMALVKKAIPLERMTYWTKIIEHLFNSMDFNIRSPDQMRTWLFDVEGLEPIKSTNQKAKGMPSMAWEKVLELPKERQRLFTPAVDAQTLKILAQQCQPIDQLLDLNVVGNLCKAFLKEPDMVFDEELGYEVKEENGLHQWLTHGVGDDGTWSTINCQYSLTETARPRTFLPNTLNLPSYVNDRIAAAVLLVVHDAFERGELPDSLMKWAEVKDHKMIPSIRSLITAPPGMVLIESDYKTAEMVGLAVISGDKDLMSLLNDPDPEWVLVKDNPHGAKAVRVSFSSTAETGIPEAKQNPEYLMCLWKGGEMLGKVTEDDLKRDADGNVIHASFDIHWSIAERVYEMPREEMLEKIFRNAAKVINFSSAYGASPASLDRKIESDTGVKPPDGTGQKGLDAIALRQPRATDFLEEMAMIPKSTKYYRAASGRIRHCVLHGAGSGVGYRLRNSLESSLGREMKNYPMQESVGATAARAGTMLRKLYLRLGLKARVITILYDSVVTLAPLEERFVCARLHTLCMSEKNTWTYDDEHGKRVLQYGVDNEFNYRWSTRPSKADIKILDDPGWHPTPGHLEWILELENWDMLVS